MAASSPPPPRKQARREDVADGSGDTDQDDRRRRLQIALCAAVGSWVAVSRKGEKKSRSRHFLSDVTYDKLCRGIRDHDEFVELYRLHRSEFKSLYADVCRVDQSATSTMTAQYARSASPLMGA